MASPEQTRRFLCDSCESREFDVTVEPAYPIGQLPEQFPGAIEWLADISYCPVCGEPIEEREM